VRAAAVLVATFVLIGCGGNPHNRGRLSAHQELSAIQTVRTPLGTGAAGAPINGVIVSGTITNWDATPLRCRASQFLLVDIRGNAVVPRAQWCAVPSIGPRRWARFSATFTTMQRTHLELRFEHPDGSYERHALRVPPA
jgi:hypothetical protein